MVSWQTIKESPNYPRLKASVEMRFARHNAVLYAVMAGVSALFILLIGSIKSPGAGAAASVMLLLFLSPIALFYVYRIFKIYHHIDAYTFTEAELIRLHSGFNRMMYFTVTVKDRSGRDITVDTHEIFAPHGIMEPLLEDYVGKKVLIGYNNATEYVVVIG